MSSNRLRAEMAARELESVRKRHPDQALLLDLAMLQEMGGLRRGLETAREEMDNLKAVLKKLGSPPWHPAFFLGPVETADGPRAEVAHGSARRVVGLADGVSPEELRVGDYVFLGNELNVIVGKPQRGTPGCGETAAFKRRTPAGKLVLEWRDEELVVAGAAALEEEDLQPGDLVRWDRNAWIAFEKIERAENKRYLLDDVPYVPRSAVGGQDENLEMLLSTLVLVLVEPDRAKAYDLNGRNTVLLVGPPGCGKTLMAKVAASEIHRISGVKTTFGVVKASEWESPWVGVTQANIMNCFKSLAEASKDGYAILFVDEVESVGRLRGGGVAGHHSDKFLATFLAELNGFGDRGNVAIVAATNRKDLLDPALLERLSDLEVQVNRPDMKGAEAIFRIHMPDSIPYSPNGAASSATRDEIIESAVSKWYSPNADNELCVIRFRDRTERPVAARDLASGRIFEQICRDARRQAFLRDARGGESGVGVADMEEAVARALQRLATTLTPWNVRSYLSDLPQDMDIVAVEPTLRKKAVRSHRYLAAI